MQGTRIGNSPIEKFSTTGNFAMPVVLLKCEFEYRKFKSNSFLRNFATQDSDARVQNNGFLVEYPYASAVFSIEILMEEIELLMAEN